MYQLLKAFGSSQARWPGTNDQDIDIALDRGNQLMLVSLLGEELVTYISLLAIMNETKLDPTHREAEAALEQPNQLYPVSWRPQFVELNLWYELRVVGRFSSDDVPVGPE